MAIRIVIMAAAILVAAVCFIATGAFLCVALFEGLKLALSPPMAALSTAVLALLLAIMALWIGSGLARTVAKTEPKTRGSATPEIGLEFGRLLGEQIHRYAGKNPLHVLIAAALAGLVLGAVPPLRRFLMGFFGKN